MWVPVGSNCLGGTFSILDPVTRTTDPIVTNPFRKCHLPHLSSGTRCWDIRTVLKCQLIYSADFHRNGSMLYHQCFQFSNPLRLVWGLSFWVIVNIKESIFRKPNRVAVKIVTLPLKSTGVIWVGADGTCFFFITSIYSLTLDAPKIFTLSTLLYIDLAQPAWKQRLPAVLPRNYTVQIITLEENSLGSNYLSTGEMQVVKGQGFGECCHKLSGGTY